LRSAGCRLLDSGDDAITSAVEAGHECLGVLVVVDGDSEARS
jgi:hypothetical protein